MKSIREVNYMGNPKYREDQAKETNSRNTGGDVIITPTNEDKEIKGGQDNNNTTKGDIVTPVKEG